MCFMAAPVYAGVTAAQAGFAAAAAGTAATTMGGVAGAAGVWGGGSILTAGTLQAVSTATQLAGTALSTFGAYQQGQAASDAAEYNAAVARNNNIIAGQLATDALARGKIKEKQQRLLTERLKGKQRTAIASSGIVVDEGTALDVLMETAELGELDALTIRSNAEREAHGFRVRGRSFASQADLLEARAEGAGTAGEIAAAGTLLSGAGTVADKWYNWRR